MPSTPIGTLEFFRLEAGEYLERLATLAQRPGGPGPDDLVRYARALRGSALMAQQAAIGKVGAALEAVGRGLREGRLTWDPALAEAVAAAVEDLKDLLRQLGSWGADQENRTARLAEGLLALTGEGAAAATTRPEAERRHEPGPDAGVRSFVARETSLIAGALERAARSLADGGPDRSALPVVLRRMQSLRGLASLNDLPPLPEILDGIERAVADLARRPALPSGTSGVLDAGAVALQRISREVAGSGRPDPQAPETAALARGLIDVLLREPGVVSVTALAPDGEAALAAPGRVPVAPITPLEFVGHGEYLMQAADDLERAQAPATRGLRLFALAGVLQSGARPDPSGVGAGLARLLDHVVEAAGALEGPVAGTLLDLLRTAGRRLREGGEQAEPAAVGAALLALVATGARPVAMAPPPAAPATVPIESLLAPAAPPTPAPAGPPVPAAAPAPPTVPIESLMLEGPDLHGSLVTLERLRRATAPGNGPPRGAETVDVRQLVYRGGRALARARQVATELRAHRRGGGAWEPLLEELLDLLPLTSEDPR